MLKYTLCDHLRWMRIKTVKTSHLHSKFFIKWYLGIPLPSHLSASLSFLCYFVPSLSCRIDGFSLALSFGCSSFAPSLPLGASSWYGGYLLRIYASAYTSIIFVWLILIMMIFLVGACLAEWDFILHKCGGLGRKHSWS